MNKIGKPFGTCIWCIKGEVVLTFVDHISSMISVLSGPNLTLELSTFDLLEKNKFFSRHPSVKVQKLEMTQRELISYYLRLDSERFNLCSYLRENKAQTSKTKAES